MGQAPSSPPASLRRPVPGRIGPLPRCAWAEAVAWLSPPVGTEDRARRRAILALRAVCAALADLVEEASVGGAGVLDGSTAKDSALLLAGPTAGLGRSLTFVATVPTFGSWAADAPKICGEQLEIVAALVEAVARGHTIWFSTLGGMMTRQAWREALAALVVASPARQLCFARVVAFAQDDVGTLSGLCTIMMNAPRRETVAAIVGAGTSVHKFELEMAFWADVSILANLHEVTLRECSRVRDLSPLADVPRLVVEACRAVVALPTMRNDVLEVIACLALADVSGLAGGHVGRLRLQYLSKVKDLSAIGAMKRPPRTVILRKMHGLHDVSMLAGIPRVDVLRCKHLDENAVVALSGKVGTLRFVK